MMDTTFAGLSGAQYQSHVPRGTMGSVISTCLKCVREKLRSDLQKLPRIAPGVGFLAVTTPIQTIPAATNRLPGPVHN